ncbi:nuclear transport factor 2 family protein [Flavobacterium sp. TSSA_36]|jgi:predicted SnoaL-like aldol condensation-catalyzing enzyme|uniref:nuclear transport factor 2 family protein n=1 Tax=Flavobacterium sp. TSSA_36 TaxID=3447669 RepID=UPI003F2A473F
MTAKEFVQAFYKSDALIDQSVLKDFIHPEIILDWDSSEGSIQMNYEGLLQYVKQLQNAYIRSKIRISHIMEENDLISVRYAHFVKTVENPREEIVVAQFMVIWQIKEGKLYRGHQMSQISK